MSNLKQKHKDYLIKNEIKDLIDLVNYVEILRNTSNLEGEDRQMLFDFAFLITNEQLSLKSFFAENKNPSKEFFNAFKQTTSSPTFMDEVLEDKTIDCSWTMCGQSECIRCYPKSTATEVPNFNLIDVEQILPKHILDVIEKQVYKRPDTFSYRPKVVSESGEKLTFDENFNLQEVGKKETEGKLFYELDFEFIKQMAERMQSNKDNSKYELWNWKKPMTPTGIEELKQAMWRHIIAVMSGELVDDGREFGHLEAISNNAMMINYQLKLKKC